MCIDHTAPVSTRPTAAADDDTSYVSDDDIQLLHNMSKVVYDSQNSGGASGSDGADKYADPPPIPPHNSATRQRHSVAEDYYRQKLYYSGSYVFIVAHHVSCLVL